MSKFQQKAEAQTRAVVGQMPGDQELVEEIGQVQRAASEQRPSESHDQGIVRDERGQEQPRDKERAQR